MMLDDQTICYDAGIFARYLNPGHPILVDDVYVTVIAVIRSDDQQCVIVQTLGDDDQRTRVSVLDYDVTVDAGMVIQYGIKRPGKCHIMPVHLKHGVRARRMAERSIARWGGELMFRYAIPDDTDLHGGLPVSEFEPVT
jgi:hypothetical protein